MLHSWKLLGNLGGLPLGLCPSKLLSCVQVLLELFFVASIGNIHAFHEHGIVLRSLVEFKDGHAKHCLNKILGGWRCLWASVPNLNFISFRVSWALVISVSQSCLSIEALIVALGLHERAVLQQLPVCQLLV